MPNNKQSAKRMRQDAKRKMANRSRKSNMKTAMRRVNEAVEGGDAAAVKTAVSAAFKAIDKAAKAHSIHANTAARRKALVARTAGAK